jgi:hypothetical protein
MSTTDSDPRIQEQLQALLDHNAPAVTLSEVRHSPRVGRARRTRTSTAPPPGSRPPRVWTALAWSLALLFLALAGLVIYAEANITSDGHSPRGHPISSTSTAKNPKKHNANATVPRLSDSIYLDATRVPAGQTIRGDLVVTNNGARMNLTPGTHGCKPSFEIYLSNGRISQVVAFPADCSTEPFYISHGTTRLAFSLLTTYTTCNAAGTPTGPDDPTCLSSGGLPPLPAGSYEARIQWSEAAPLPQPEPVAVTLTRAPSTTTTTTTAAPATQTDVFQPWLSASSLAPGFDVIGRPSGGDCWTESILDYRNRYAWRCMSGTAIFDPCFAPPGASNVTQVACATSPTGGIYLMTLGTPLTQSSSARNPAYDYPWYIELSNGQGCTGYGGAGPPTDDGVILSYGCITGGAAEPDRNTQPWSDRYAATDNGPLQNVTVTQAWN